MTPAYITLPKEQRSYRFSILRILIIGGLLSLITVGCLYLHHHAFSHYLTYLKDAEKKSTHWIVKQLGYMLPFLAIAIFQYAVYAKHNRKDGVLQREMAWEILIVAAFTYLILLPAVCYKSDITLKVSLVAGLDVEKNAGKEYQTLLLSVAEWFIRFAIPLCILFIYHGAKAKAEKLESSMEAAEATDTASETVCAPSEDISEEAPENAPAEDAEAEEKSVKCDGKFTADSPSRE